MINALSMKAAIAALGDEAFIEETVRVVHAGRVYLYQKLEELGCKYWRTQANFVLIRPEIPSSEFVHQMEQQGVMVRSAEGSKDANAVRVTIGDQEANEAFIHALKIVLS